VGFTVRRGERVALIGANGIGKSTLLKILTDNLQADEGEHEWGHEVRVGYFPQDHHDTLTHPDQTALSVIWDTCPAETTGFVRGQLGRVLFSGDDVEKKIGSLSGGEAARLVFAKLAVEKPNVLVLDEPTNHLDLEAIEALTEALTKYDGTLMFVSHDRYFVEALATRIIELRRDGLRDFPGTYDEYVERAGDDHLDAEAVVLKAKKEKREAKAGGAKRKKPSSRERALPRRRDELVAQIEATEGEKGELERRWATPGFFDGISPEEVEQLKARADELDEKLHALMTEWESVEAEIAELDAS
jgi:ABC-type multidrug transport system ATPase subunit